MKIAGHILIAVGVIFILINGISISWEGVLATITPIIIGVEMLILADKPRNNREIRKRLSIIQDHFLRIELLLNRELTIHSDDNPETTSSQTHYYVITKEAFDKINAFEDELDIECTELLKKAYGISSEVFEYTKQKLDNMTQQHLLISKYKANFDIKVIE